MPIAEAFERDGEEAFREREAEVVGELLERADGGAIALGGGSVLSERIRAALDRHIVVWLQVDAEEAWRRIAHTDRPLATSAEDVARLLDGAPAALRGARRRDRALRATGDRRPGPALDPRARRAARRDPDALGGERLRRVPGLRRPRPPRRRLVAAARAAASASPTPTSAPLYADGIEPLAARVEVEPGEGAKTMAEAERVLRELARRGDDPRGPPGRARRRRRRRPRRLLRPHSTSAASRWSRCRPRWSPRSTPPTAARPASTCRRARTTPAPTTCRRPCSPTPPTLATLPPAELAAGFVEVLKTGLLAGGALWERVRGDRGARPRRRSTTSSSPAPATSARSSPPTSATPACATSSTSATPSATRSRRRAATRATATARRSGSACWRRCGSPTPPELRDEVEATARPPRPAGRASTPAIDVDAVLDAAAARQEADRRGRRLRPALRARRAPRRPGARSGRRVRAAVEELHRA